jgi:hypothetical protein
MRAPGYLIGFILAVLLASTTPVGTGSGAHQFDLLHPLFSHVHLVNGHVLSHEQLAQAPASMDERAWSGPAVGSGGDSAFSDAGLGVSPTLPARAVEFVADTRPEIVVYEVRIPSGWLEAPPDPPPL